MARALLAAGTDPSEVRKTGKVEQQRQQHTESLLAAGEALPGTFEAVALEWLEVLRRVESRGAVYSAHRVKQTCGLVFRYAIATGHAERDPVPGPAGRAGRTSGQALPGHHRPVRVGALLRAFDAYTGQPGTRIALKLAALVFQRPGNVIAMRWDDLDLDAATWSIPSENMKRLKVEKVNGAAHVVPLARQSVALLRELQPLTGSGPYCFPGLRSRDRHISNVTLNAAMRRLGFSGEEMTAHGFRALARTVIVENLRCRRGRTTWTGCATVRR
jgi:integrase